MVQRTRKPSPSRPSSSFLAADQAVRGFRERWYPSLVDWQGEPPPREQAQPGRVRLDQTHAEHVPQAAPRP